MDINDKQFGFIPGMSTTEPVFATQIYRCIVSACGHRQNIVQDPTWANMFADDPVYIASRGSGGIPGNMKMHKIHGLMID